MKTLFLLVALLVAVNAGAQSPAVTALASSRDGLWLAMGTASGRVVVVESATGEWVASRDFEGTEGIASLTFGGDTARLTVSTRSGTTGVWFFRTSMQPVMRPSATEENHKPVLPASAGWKPESGKVFIVAISQALWAAGTHDGQVVIGSLSGPQVLSSWQAQSSPVTSLEWLADARLVTGSADGTVCLWGSEHGTILGKITP
jgi:WD40 repeat protein